MASFQFAMLVFLGLVAPLSMVNAATRASSSVNTSAQSALGDSKATARGLQIKIDRMFNKFRVSGLRRGNGTTVLEQNIGLRMGYAYLKPKDVGVIARGGLDIYDQDVTAASAEVLGTYSFSAANYVFAGPKLDYFYGNKMDEVIGFGYGVEGGLGFRVTPQLGVEVSYTYTHHNQKFAVDVDGFVLGGTMLF